MTDLNDLSREELVALVTALGNEDDEKTHDPDSLMAMMLASPKEARAISWRMQHPLARLFIIVFCLLMFLGFMFVGLVLLSVSLSK